MQQNALTRRQTYNARRTKQHVAPKYTQYTTARYRISLEKEASGWHPVQTIPLLPAMA
jgi:hypothetical protein